MSYYTQNVDALLYIGTSIADPLPAPGSDTFTEVPLTQIITPPTVEQSVGTFNVTNDGNKRVVGGKLADQTIEGNLVIDWTTTPHQNMYADSNIVGGRKRNWRIKYPDANDRQLDFVGFVSRWQEEAFDATGDAKEHVAGYRISVDGAVTATP